MASILTEDGANPAPPINGGAMDFDVQVFRKYLEAMLVPGEHRSIAQYSPLSCPTHDPCEILSWVD